MNINRYHNMNAAELFDTVFDLYKESFWMQLLMSMVTSVISGVAVLVFTIFSFIGIIITGLSENLIISIVIASLLLVIILPVILALSLASKMHLSRQTFYGTRIDFGLAVSDTFKTLPNSVTTLVAVGIIAIPFIAAGIAALVAFFNFIGILDGLMPSSLGLYNITNISFFVGLIAIALAAVFVFSLFYVITSVAVPVAVFEKRYFFGAVKRSLELIKGDFWKIYGIRLVWIGVSYCVSYSILLVFSVSMVVVNVVNDSFANIDTVNSIIIFAQYAFSILLGIVIAPLPEILSSIIYFNQCLKKEGLDIKIGFDRLSFQAQYNNPVNTVKYERISKQL